MRTKVIERLDSGLQSAVVRADISVIGLIPTATLATNITRDSILFEGALLKPNMVLPGKDCPDRPSPADVAKATVTVLSRTIPPALVGIHFLSGGISEENASIFLNEMNKLDARRPWALSFSYGRALQASVLQAWGGEDANKEAAQAALLERSKANSEATLGTYEGGAGGAAANESTYVANYVYVRAMRIFFFFSWVVVLSDQFYPPPPFPVFRPFRFNFTRQ